MTNALVLCDSGSTHSWVSADLVKRLHLIGNSVNLTIKVFNSTSLIKTHQLSFQVSAETNNSEFLFSFRAYVKDHIRIGSGSKSIPELQEKYPQLAPIKPIQYKYDEVVLIFEQDFYHAIRPVEYLLGEDSISPCAVRLLLGWTLVVRYRRPLSRIRLALSVLSKTCLLRTKLKLGLSWSRMEPSSK